LKAFLQYYKKYDFDHEKMKKIPLKTLRKELLEINGIGQETADSILLYALDKGVFVIDAYTKRILSRHNICKPDDRYENIQLLFMSQLPSDTHLFNEYHALIVRCGKELCKKKQPLCSRCPLSEFLPSYIREIKAQND